MSDDLHPPETVTSLLLLRHGHTEPTEKGKLYNDPLEKLTPRGEEQAAHLGRWLKKQEPDVLLSSTAVRVQSTAEIIAKECGIACSTIEGFNEWSVGLWEGRTYLDLKKNNPEEYERWSQDPISNAPPEGESIIDLCNRIKSKLGPVVKRHEGKRIALVTHAGVIRSIMVECLGMPVRNFWRLNIPVGSATKIDISDNFATIHYMSLVPNI